jgi:hypothetical protein
MSLLSVSVLPLAMVVISLHPPVVTPKPLAAIVASQL